MIMTLHETFLVDWTSRGQVNSTLMQLPKLRSNLCLIKWLKPNLNLVSNVRSEG